MAKTIFPTPKVVGKTVKMLLAVAKSESYARNENSYYNMATLMQELRTGNTVSHKDFEVL